MQLDFLHEVFAEFSEEPALIWREDSYSYGWLSDAVSEERRLLDDSDIPAGAVISLEADFSPRSVAILLALIERDAVIVPLTDSVSEQKPEFRSTAQVEWILTLTEDDSIRIEATSVEPSHELLLTIKSRACPGLVLFSSGSTGKSKAALHDLAPMLDKFRVRRHRRCAITFLLFDHIGGFNTLMYNLSNGGCTVIVGNRRPETIARAVERHKVQLLPTSPTFLNLLLVSGAYRQYDMSSLEVVTYGTEVMPQSTLERFHAEFPDVKLQQTYGLSEIGIMRSKSKASDSLFVKVGGEGFETRVVDGLLEIKAKSAMLGYLNAPSPFTDDGWLKTGDAVEVDGEYIRILGRRSELINVGGEKVYPAEVESVMQLMEGVREVVVFGESNSITGQIVCLRVRLATDETLNEFRKRMHRHCAGRLQRFKIPQKVELVEGNLHSERFKRIRRSDAAGSKPG